MNLSVLVCRFEAGLGFCFDRAYVSLHIEFALFEAGVFFEVVGIITPSLSFTGAEESLAIQTVTEIPRGQGEKPLFTRQLASD